MGKGVKNVYLKNNFDAIKMLCGVILSRYLGNSCNLFNIRRLLLYLIHFHSCFLCEFLCLGGSMPGSIGGSIAGTRILWGN